MDTNNNYSTANVEDMFLDKNDVALLDSDRRFMFTFVLCATSLVALELLFCIVAILLRLNKLKDVSGGGAFIMVALLSFFFNAQHDLADTQLPGLRQLLVSSCVCLWALRLAAYLLYRHICMGQDKRAVPGQPPGCSTRCGYWMFQAVWVLVVSLPVIAINSSSHEIEPRLWTPGDIAGTTVLGVGGVFEMIADQQKLNQKRRGVNYGRWCTFGFWKWSRHPNYLFEMITWWGVWSLVTQCACSLAVQLLSLLSPLFVMTILLGVSGIPVVEAAADAKYGKLPEYGKFKHDTSVLIPLHPWLYKRLPPRVKRTIFFDFPCYNRSALLTEQKFDCEMETIDVSPSNHQQTNLWSSDMDTIK